MKKILLIIISLLIITNGYSINLKYGWQLIGALNNIDVNQTFHNQNIKSVWSYKDGKWKVFLPNDLYMMKEIESGKYPNIQPLNSLKKGSGFWVFSNSELNLSTCTSLDYPSKIDIEILHKINNGHRNGEGSFLKLKNNTLAYVYTCFKKGDNDNSYSDICIIKSSDKDRKIWSQPEVLIKNHGKENIMSVSLLRKEDNSIIIQYLEKNSCNDLKIVRRYSYDELKTLSDIKYLKVGDGYNVVNNDRLLYYDNKIYTPISKHSCHNNVFVYSGIMELAITDDNDNITLIKIPNDSNITLQEPGIINLKLKGHMLMWFRNNTNHMLVATSNDYGYHFSSIRSGILKVVPYSPSTIKRYNNDLFVVYNKWSINTINKERTPLMLAISNDDLKTISQEYTLENNRSLEYMYTSMYKDSNNLILAYMVQNKKSYLLKIIKIKNIFKK